MDDKFLISQKLILFGNNESSFINSQCISFSIAERKAQWMKKKNEKFLRMLMPENKKIKITISRR